MRRVITVMSALAMVVGAFPLLARPAAAAGGAIEGVVTGPGGTLGASVCVATYPDAVASTTTDTQGHYRLELPPGRYLIRFDDCAARDWVPVFYPAGSNAVAATQIAVADTVVSGRNVTMAQGGALRGTVTDTGGLPVPGTILTAMSKTEPAGTYIGRDAVANSAGGWEIHGLPATSFAVRAAGDPDAFAPAFTGLVPALADATAYPVAVRQATAVDVQIPRAADVAGRITDAEGAALAGACVTVWSSPRSSQPVQADADGRYRVRTWPFSVKVSATGPGCSGFAGWSGGGSSYEQATELRPGEDGALTGVDVLVPAAPHISGHVYDAAGAPVPQASVHLIDGVSNRSTSRYVSTDSLGAFTFAGLSAKLYKIEVKTPTDRPELLSQVWPDALRIADGGAIDTTVASRDDIDLHLPLGASVSGTVTLADGAAASPVCVSVTPQLVGVVGSAARTTPVGTYRVLGLPPGPAKVAMRDCSGSSGGPSAPGPTMWRGNDDPGSGELVELALGQEAAGVDQVMPRGGSAHGVVSDAHGNGIANVCIQSGFPLDHPSMSSVSVSTDASGAWAIHGLAPGDYEFAALACAGSFVSRPIGQVAVAAGSDAAAPQTTLQPGGSISGLVRNQYGLPVQDVCVQPVYLGEGFAYSQRSQPTDGDGRYLMTGLQPGRYTARFVECGAGVVPTWYQSPLEVGAATFEVAPEQETLLANQLIITLSVPSLPISVTAGPLDRGVHLSWRPPSDDGHAPVTAYTITASNGAVVGRVIGSARSFDVAGLANGSRYRFGVAAVNRKGVGEAALSPVAVPAALGALSITGPTATTAGSRIAVSGKLLTAAGAPYPNRTLTLLGRPAGSTASWQTLAHPSTSSTGVWRAVVTLLKPMSYRVAVGTKSASVVIRVAPRVTVTASGRVITVATSPARPGQTVYIQRNVGGGWTAAYTRTLGSTGRTSLSVRAGIYRATLHAVGYWLAGTSAPLRIS